MAFYSIIFSCSLPTSMLLLSLPLFFLLSASLLSSFESFGFSPFRLLSITKSSMIIFSSTTALSQWFAHLDTLAFIVAVWSLPFMLLQGYFLHFFPLNSLPKPSSFFQVSHWHITRYHCEHTSVHYIVNPTHDADWPSVVPLSHPQEASYFWRYALLLSARFCLVSLLVHIIVCTHKIARRDDSKS